MSDMNNSNRITREYIDSLRIETRYMDSTNPDTTFTLYGQRFASPIMTAALSHLDHFMFPGASVALAQGAKDADAVLWYGMAPDEEIEALNATGARMIEIIKPYADRDKIFAKIRHAEALGVRRRSLRGDQLGAAGRPAAGDGQAPALFPQAGQNGQAAQPADALH